MTDSFDPVKRSDIMSRVRGRDTKPELLIRKALHSEGFRYRLHDTKLPGKPDMVFPRYRSAIFVHGCFWHGHTCKRFKWPASNAEFWKAKIGGTIERDKKNLERLHALDWRVLIVWECATRGRERWPIDSLTEAISVWLLSDSKFKELQET